ncbi:MAG: DUF4173 domain-containing protein [Clostridia bacterium]|nr:DUF4173 domain-containing protein [Clostridia bacterium]
MDEQQTTANTANTENTVNAAPSAEPFTANDPPKTEFSTKEKVLAWLAALVGYLFCRTFFVWNKPFMGLIFTVLLFAFAFVFFGKQRRKARCYFYPVSALLLSAGLFLNGSPLLRFCVFTYAVVAFFLFCQTGSDTALEDCAGQLYVLETVKALLVSPFKSIGAAVRSIGSNKGGKKLGKTLLLILAGIGLTIIPTTLVLGLLSYDANFTTILENIRANVFDQIFSRLWSLIFGIPLGMFVYGALYTGAHPAPDTYTRESCINLENKMKFMPALVGAVALIPLLFLYIVFIIAHADYYQAVFSGALPKAYTYAEFARDGFFRLCVAAAINAVVLILLRVFTRKTSTDRISPVVKICTAVLSLVTIVISATAISQMLMYVSAYGLTRLRLYTLWFMALIILLFFLAIIKQFVTKLPFAAAALAIFVLFFALLAVPDTDALIAEHNYDCYVSGRTEEIDVYYLEQLGPSAIPTLCQLATDERADNMVRSHAATLLEQYARDNKDRSVWELSLPELRAERAYKEYKNNDAK